MPKRKKLLLTLLIICVVIASVGVVVNYIVCKKAKSSRHWENLVGKIECMPKLGRGTLFVTYNTVDEEWFKIYHWDLPLCDRSEDKGEIRAWLDEMESWCTKKYDVIDKFSFDTACGSLRVITYSSKDLTGSLFCFAEKPTDNTPIQSIVILMEVGE